MYKENNVCVLGRKKKWLGDRNMEPKWSRFCSRLYKRMLLSCSTMYEYMCVVHLHVYFLRYSPVHYIKLTWPAALLAIPNTSQVLKSKLQVHHKIEKIDIWAKLNSAVRVLKIHKFLPTWLLRRESDLSPVTLPLVRNKRN